MLCSSDPCRGLDAASREWRRRDGRSHVAYACRASVPCQRRPVAVGWAADISRVHANRLTRRTSPGCPRLSNASRASSAPKLVSRETYPGFECGRNPRTLLSGLNLALKCTRTTSASECVFGSSKIAQLPSDLWLRAGATIGWEAGIRTAKRPACTDVLANLRCYSPGVVSVLPICACIRWVRRHSRGTRGRSTAWHVRVAVLATC